MRLERGRANKARIYEDICEAVLSSRLLRGLLLGLLVGLILQSGHLVIVIVAVLLLVLLATAQASAAAKFGEVDAAEVATCFGLCMLAKSLVESNTFALSCW